MSRAIKALAVITVLLLLGSMPLMAQYRSWNYNEFRLDGSSPQSRNMPSGTVFEAGSQVLYFLDTGRTSGADRGDGPAYRNFVSITNTHPSQAVTVHFRYFNDECEDFLDFLIVLTCNDTLLFDPFDFVIPRAQGINTGERFWGGNDIFDQIPDSDWGSGRFLLFATTAGTQEWDSRQGDYANYLFPKEWDNITSSTHDCLNLRGKGYFGDLAGLNRDNLHVFNASAVVFNYLVGHQTLGIPVGNVFQSYGLNAFVRPAIDRAWYCDDLGGCPTGWSDGDGPTIHNAPWWDGGDEFRLISGTESLRASDGQADGIGNALYLRSEVHGGVFDGDNQDDTGLYGGSLAWYSIHGGGDGDANTPADQRAWLLSAVDDYNGSGHASLSGGAGFDRSYNIVGARTQYVLQVYQNSEDVFDFEDQPPPINISPPPPTPIVAELLITVDCLKVWMTSTLTSQTLTDEFELVDLNIIDSDVYDWLGSTGANGRDYSNEDDPNDLSVGWIRLVGNDWAEIHGDAEPELAGSAWKCTERLSNGARGSNDYNGRLCLYRGPIVHDNEAQVSAINIGFVQLRFSGFGAAWWLSGSSYDPNVAATGDPNPYN